MTKKFISLLISVIMVVGLIPVMSVSAADNVIDIFDENFEAWSDGEKFYEGFTGYTDTVLNNYIKLNGTTKFKIGAYLSAEIVSMDGYDGKTTNAIKVISSDASSGVNLDVGAGRLLFSTNAVTYTNKGAYTPTKDYVTEFKMYIPESINSGGETISQSIGSFGFGPFYKSGNKLYLRYKNSSGSTKNESFGEVLTPGWHKFTIVQLFGSGNNKVIYYHNDEVLTYKYYSWNAASNMIQFLSTVKIPGQHLIFDDFKVFEGLVPTTVSSVYSDASGFSKTASPVVTFSQSVLDYNEITSDGIGLEDVELIATSGATPVNIDISLSNDGKTLTIDPKEDLNYGTQYTVKLTGLVDMYGQAIEDTQFTFTTMEESKISCAQPTFKKENLFVYGNQGTTITALENGYIRTDLTVSNTDASEKEVFVIALLKENGDIKGFQFDNVTVPASGSVDFNCSFQVDDAANQTIETFVWDSFPGKTPLASKWTFSNFGCTETVIEDQ